ncbi:MAG: hypothetical protein RR230_07755 [Oscillospiraceae bacterium]
MERLSIKAGGAISHAYMIASASEEERDSLSRSLAAAMLCESSGERPCGHCRHCRKVLADIHPDVITIDRDRDEKGAEKREISVGRIRLVVSDAQVMPNEAERKVYLIRNADTMNTSAQNALLKLLEEPPASAAFILCAANANLLLPTVRSRCALISRNADTERDLEATALAREYLALAAKGDRAELFRWCTEREGMDPRAAEGFVRACRETLTDILCGRSDLKLEPRSCARLDGLFKKCAEYLRANTGVRHVFGLLAVDGALSDKQK